MSKNEIKNLKEANRFHSKFLADKHGDEYFISEILGVGNDEDGEFFIASTIDMHNQRGGRKFYFNHI